MIRPTKIFADQSNTRAYYVEAPIIQAVGDIVDIEGLGLCRVDSIVPGQSLKVTQTTSPTVHVGIVLDESASMFGCADRTISSLNEYLQTLKSHKLPYRVSLETFNTDGTKFRYTDQDIREIAPFARALYTPHDGTPLYDATAEMINFIAGRKQPQQLAILIVLTDGEENSSRMYTQYQIQQLIRQKQAEGWTIVFLGADLSREQVSQFSSAMGVHTANTMSYGKAHTQDVFRHAAGATQSYAKGESLSGNVFNRSQADLDTAGTLDELQKRAQHQQDSANKATPKGQ